MKLYHSYKVNQDVFILEEKGELYHYVENYDEDGFTDNIAVWHKNKDITLTDKGQEVQDAVQALHTAP
jgi:predicted GNAT family N-acyltransferase